MTAEDFIKNFLPQYEEKEGKILYRCKYMGLSDIEKASLLKKELITYHFPDALDNFIDDICLVQRYMFLDELKVHEILDTFSIDSFFKHNMLLKMIESGRHPTIDDVISLRKPLK